MKHTYRLFILLFFASLAHAGLAQNSAIAPAPESTPEVVCATAEPTEQEAQDLPWYGDTLYLHNYYDSLRTAMDGAGGHESRTSEQGVEDVWLRIPIQFWVYTDGGGPGVGNTPLPNARDFQMMLDNANTVFRDNGIKVRFYMLCPRFEDNADAVTINNITEMTILGNSNKTLGAVNIHICQNVDFVYNVAADAIFLPRAVYRRNFLNRFDGVTSISHEIGHYFGLFHTFAFYNVPCLREPVARGWVPRPGCLQSLYPKTCAVTGDMLTDTDADREDFQIQEGAACVYAGSATDFWGARYHPSATNYMSYIARRCRATFTAQQRAVMLRNMNILRRLQRDRMNWDGNSQARQFDRYEPDNADITARPLLLDATQVHSMHGIGCGTDAEDWLSFTVPNSGENVSYILEVADQPGYANPVATAEAFATIEDAATGLRVAGASVLLTPLPAAGGVRRWVLSCNALNARAGQPILIRFTNTNDTQGRYSVTLERSAPTVAGPASVCPNTSTLYTVQGLLPGSVVTWSVTPSSVATASPATGPSTTVQAVGYGQATLIASVSEGGCSVQLPVNVTVAAPAVYVGLVNPPFDLCPGVVVTFQAQVEPVNAATSYQWSVGPGAQIQGSATGAQVQVRTPFANGFTDVSVTVPNPCGGPSLSGSGSVYVYSGPEGCANSVRLRPLALQVHPNPADAGFTLTDGNASAERKTREHLDYTLFDVYGVARLSGQTSPGNQWIDTRRIPAGIYQLRVRAATGQTEFARIQIAR